MATKHTVGLKIERNALGGEAEGIIRFPGGQTIIDGTKLRNGLVYDIDSMTIDEYAGQVTADHLDLLNSIVGKVINLRKEDGAVKIDGIQFATTSAAGRLAYDLMSEGFLTDMSVETYGPYPDATDDTYHDHKLIGLSTVVVGNSKSARVRQLVTNSFAKSKEAGIDTTAAEEAFARVLPAELPETEPVTNSVATPPKQETPQVSYVTLKNSRGFAVELSYKNAAGEEVKRTLADGDSVDVSEDQKTAVETQINSAQAPAPDFKGDIAEAVNAAMAGVTAKLDELEKNAFNKAAKEPEFVAENGAKAGNPRLGGVAASELDKLTPRERAEKQMNAVAGAVAGRSLSAMQELEAINAYNLEKLQEEGKVNNTISLSDLGNFVVAPEYLPGVVRRDSNYTPLLSTFDFQNTLSLQTAWLEATGDVQMTDVGMEDVGDNTNLKPLQDYTMTSKTAQLKEFAAVLVADTSAVRFSAIDILNDINNRFNKAYDRALAQSVIGRIALGVNGNGNASTFNYASSTIDSLISLLNSVQKIVEYSPNGVFLMTEATRLELLKFQLKSGANGPLVEVFTTGDQPRFFGRPYVTVPADLLPQLNTAGSKTWTFEGQSVTVPYGVLYMDPSNFMGRVSGGLSYNVSAEAAYESGGTVKSAYQRDQLVFRGFGYRKSALLDTTQASGILSPGIS